MSHTGRPREFLEEEVLDRGIEYFRIHGYEGGGLTGLLELTGLSRQSLYNTFGDKKSFFQKCIVRYRQVWGRRLFAKLHKENADRNDLKDVFLELIRFLSEEPDKNCLIVKTTMELGITEEVVMEQVRFHSKYIMEGVKNILQRERARGIPKEGHPEKDLEKIASLVLSVVFGLHIMARSRMSPDTMRAAVEGLLEVIYI